MKIPMSWLKAYIPAETDVRRFMDDMTRTGTVAESCEPLGAEISKVVVGHVRSVEKHPNADRLFVIQVDIGDKALQIVTAAKNVQVGDYVPVALDGATLAEGKKIKRGKLRGCASEGMMCGIDELGYKRHDYPEAPEDGIYIFTEPQTPGADVRPILELTDDVIDFEITSNRADCNAVLGIAREAAATYGKAFAMPEVVLKSAGETGDGAQAGDLIAVEIQNPALCPRYIARVVKNVRIAPSPQWLRHRLTASGVRPINNIVDITNYVMLEYGQPMHAFDIDNIAERKIIVRNAAEGENFTTLDGIQRQLDPSMLVIADPEKAVAIAGIMGGENTMVTGHATAILFEAANFDGPNVRLTAKKLGMRTDASARFEKGLDPNLPLAAVNRAMQLIEQLQCGEVIPGIVDAYPRPRNPWTVNYDPARINALLGTAIPAADMCAYLARVNIETEASGAVMTATVPTFRPDITCEADIAEEVARFYGYDHITPVFTQRNVGVGGRNARQRTEVEVKRILRGLGYNEALTCPFEGPKVFDKLLYPPDSPLRDAIRIQNPLGEDFCLMRTTTLDGMLQSLAINASRRNESVRLFEAAPVYLPKALPLTELPNEVRTLTFCAYDKSNGGETLDFYDFKGDVEQLFAALGVDGVRYETCDSLPHMHPGRTAFISIDGEPLGYFGELTPRVAANYDITARVYLAVLKLDLCYAIVTEKTGYTRYKPLPKYPAVERDIALSVKREAQAAVVEAAIREKAGPLLSALTLFDVYQGKQIEEGYKSMAYTLAFRAPDHTLTDEEVSPVMRQILLHLEEKLGAVLRDK